MRFIFYKEIYRKRIFPTHLLFHMATGSGKTVVVAALIVYLYREGYRNFLFFVNSSNIIQKTKENFLNPRSKKYLFADSIKIGNKEIRIREVSNFDESVESDINIHFTTIQELHRRMTQPKENHITREDFQGRKVVFISDEAHHMNTLTKSKLTMEEESAEKSWESTVQTFFRSNDDNFLIELTATMDIENPNIQSKYDDKLLYDYSLKQFRQDQYSKDIELRQAPFSTPGQSMLPAVIFSQYRRKIAEKNGLQIKPVVMMKSKTIRESKQNEEIFCNLISTLTSGILENIRSQVKEDVTLTKMYNYIFDELGLSYDNFISEIKEDFSPEKIMNINDTGDLEINQVKVNSLENYDNEIRVVFAVNKLNEGWDVLNLFDIVRLYQTHVGKAKQLGATTTQEAQLIGRGARYYSFTDPIREDLSKDKRKYDGELSNPLRILEELHYHCSHNPKYIDEIKSALQKTGILGEPQRVVVKVKDEFKQSDCYKDGFIFSNERITRSRKNVKSLSNYSVEENYVYPVALRQDASEESALMDQQKTATGLELQIHSINISSFGIPVLRNAVDENAFFYFDSLKKFLPALKSKKDFFDMVRKFTVEIEGDKKELAPLTKKQMKEIIRFILAQIEATIKNNSSDYKGSKRFTPEKINKIVVDREVLFDNATRLAEMEREKLFDKKWYVYEKNPINALEQKFIEYVDRHSDRIDKLYEEFFLIRNEGLLKLYDFTTGAGFEPDFILILKAKISDPRAFFQLFIEAKGEHIAGYDSWKEKFLREIKLKSNATDLKSGYTMVGLPFFQIHGKSFRQCFERLVLKAK